MKIKKGVSLIDQHDKNFMYGGKFGGNFIPETLKKPIDDLTKLFSKLRREKKFLSERDYHFKTYVGAPTPFIKLENLTDRLGGAQIYAKVVSEANGGAHKIYNATVHCLIAKRAGKKFIVGDTGAGYAGKMLSMAAKKFGLKCKIFMGAKDIKRQRPNVEAMKKNGAEVVPVTTGSQTLVDAVSECMRYWVSNCDLVQVKDEFGKIPKKLKLINCVGGGSSAAGFWNEFMNTNAEFIGVEAGGPKNSKLHAAPLTNGSKIGILHGAAQYVIQDKEGQIGSTESISAGLDYPGISPLHCFLKDAKRARYTSASDEDALKAYELVSKLENISPSLEPSHAFAEAIRLAPKLKSSEVIIVNSCGDSLKDKDIIKQRLGSYIR